MVASAFFYLSSRSFRNRMRVRLRRLKEPRYAIGLVLGLGYMWWFVFRPLFTRPMRGGGAGPLVAMTQAPEAFLTIGSILMFVFAALQWLWPGKRPALAFSRAEVQFLFQAPLTRRQIVHYKLIRSQVGIWFSSVITTLLLRPGSLVMGWTTVVGMWLIFSIISLHVIGISLSQQSVRKAGLTGLAKQWLPFAVLVGSILVLVATVAFNWSSLAAATTPRQIVAEIQRLTTSGAAAVILWPFRAILRVPLAANAAAFFAALPWALLILAVNYLWVLRADVAFEEASAARSEQIAKRLADMRAGRRSAPTRTKARAGKDNAAGATPFALALTGRPETAILWKNLIMIGRAFSLKSLWRFLPITIVFLIFISRSGNAGWISVVSILCFAFLGFTVMLGPQIVRNDLRQDLAQLTVLKTWPVSGQALLRGELAAPAIVLTSIAWLLMVGAAVTVGSVDEKGALQSLTVIDKVVYTLSAMCIVPGLILAQLVIQNGIAIAFPAWSTAGSSRARGIEATGQRLLMMAGNILALLLALLPGVLVGGVIGWLVYWQTGVVIVLIPALIVGAFMMAECWLATEGLGRLLGRTDVSAIEPTE